MLITAVHSAPNLSSVVMVILIVPVGSGTGDWWRGEGGRPALLRVRNTTLGLGGVSVPELVRQVGLPLCLRVVLRGWVVRDLIFMVFPGRWVVLFPDFVLST